MYDFFTCAHIQIFLKLSSLLNYRFPYCIQLYTWFTQQVIFLSCSFWAFLIPSKLMFAGFLFWDNDAFYAILFFSSCISLPGKCVFQYWDAPHTQSEALGEGHKQDWACQQLFDAELQHGRRLRHKPKNLFKDIIIIIIVFWEEGIFDGCKAF